MSGKTNERMYPESELTLRDTQLQEYQEIVKELRNDLIAANEKNERLVVIFEESEKERTRQTGLIEEYNETIKELNLEMEELRKKILLEESSDDLLTKQLTSIHTDLQKLIKRSGFLWWLNPKNW